MSTVPEDINTPQLAELNGLPSRTRLESARDALIGTAVVAAVALPEIARPVEHAVKLAGSGVMAMLHEAFHGPATQEYSPEDQKLMRQTAGFSDDQQQAD